MKFCHVLLFTAFLIVPLITLAQTKDKVKSSSNKEKTKPTKKNEEKDDEDDSDDEPDTFDTLFLNNQQILIGELKLAALGKARIDADQIDVVNVELKNIRTISANTHSYRIETVHKEIFTSVLLPDKKKDGYVLINDSNTVKSIKIVDILSIKRLSEGNTGFWQGAFALGYAYSRSSHIGLLNADAAVDYITPKFELAPYFATIITQLNNKWIRSNEMAGIYGYYNINPTWQYVGILNYQRNLRLGLARRFQEGAGVAFAAITTPSIRYKIASGLVFNQEEGIDNIAHRVQLEIPILNNLELYHFDDPELNIFLVQNVFFSLTTAGRIRHDGEIKCDWELFDNFYAHFLFYDYYDSKPIVPFAHTLDYGFILGFTFTFSQ